MSEPEEQDIDRESWRHRLGEAGAPAETTDARIRAEARRALAPRASRWTLPASLVAALVIAVFLAQWQVEDERLHPLIDESQVERQGAPAAPASEEPAPAAEQEPAATTAVPQAKTDLPDLGESQVLKRERPSNDQAYEAPAAAAPPPTVRADEVAPSREALDKPAAPAKQAAPAEPLGNISVTAGRTPEEWYAEIEALRAAGRDAEADAELTKLEEAYPGWLERRRQEQR